MIDNHDAEILEWIRFAKGDVEGHEFHGNQYSEGDGNAGKADEPTTAAPVAPLKSASAAHVSRTLNAARLPKYSESYSGVRGMPARYSGFKVKTDATGKVSVFHGIGNDDEGWRFNNNQPGTEQSRIDHVAAKISNYEHVLGKAGFVTENQGNELRVLGRK